MRRLTKSLAFLSQRGGSGLQTQKVWKTAWRMHTQRVTGADPLCSCVFGRKLGLLESFKSFVQALSITSGELKPPHVPLRAAGCIPAVTFPSHYRMQQLRSRLNPGLCDYFAPFPLCRSNRGPFTASCSPRVSV